MRIGMLRLGLSLMIVVGFWTNRLPAQHPHVVPEHHHAPGPRVLVVPEVPYEPARHPYSHPALAVRPRPEPARHLHMRVLNVLGVGCETDRYGGACAGLTYELQFVFGSCRSFYFCEQCVPWQACLPCQRR